MLRARASEIARWIGGELSGSDAWVEGVGCDSRAITPGQLFVALAGARRDGHEFAAEACARGAAAVLVERRVEGCGSLILHRHPRLALGLLARAWRERVGAEVIAVAGSSGKTTVKTLIARILAVSRPTHASEGNLNTEVGLPLVVCNAPPESRCLVLELGERLPGDVAWLAWVARPRVGVVTNVGPAHLQYLGSLDGVADSLAALPAALPAEGVAVLPAEDPFLPRLLRDCPAGERLRFGLSGDAEVRAEALSLSAAGSRFRLVGPPGAVEVSLPLAGVHNVRNATAAAAAALAAGASLQDCAIALAGAEAVAGRLKAKQLAGGVTLIDDSYNANPASVAAAIETLGLAPSPRILVLGDMAELGDFAAEAHRSIGRLARERGIERLFALGAKAADAARAFGSGGRPFADLETLIEALRAELRPGLTVLVKGSRASAMERVVAALSAPEEGRDAA
jgi:UDP-N-acetylmuramoyl-tripeptide--D-alanyl-D-alanine ligase